MRINSANSSEIFDAYSDVMQKFLLKKAMKFSIFSDEDLESMRLASIRLQSVLKKYASAKGEVVTEVGEALLKKVFPEAASKATIESVDDIYKLFMATSGEDLHALIAPIEQINRNILQIGVYGDQEGTEFLKAAYNQEWVTTQKANIDKISNLAQSFLDQTKGIPYGNDPNVLFLKKQLDMLTTKKWGYYNLIDQSHNLAVYAARQGVFEVADSAAKVESEVPIPNARKAPGVRGPKNSVVGPPTQPKRVKLPPPSRPAPSPETIKIADGLKSDIGKASGIALTPEVTKGVDNAVATAEGIGSVRGATESVSKQLDTAVAEGTITQEEAKELRKLIADVQTANAQANAKMEAELGAIAKAQAEAAPTVQRGSENIANMENGIAKSVDKGINDVKRAANTASGDSTNLSPIVNAFRTGGTKMALLQLASTVAHVAWPVIFAVGAVGGTWWLVSSMMGDSDAEEALKESATDLRSKITAARLAHRILRFNPDTYGAEQNIDVMEELIDNAESPQELLSGNDRRAAAAGANLEQLRAEINEFISRSEEIRGDLSSSAGFKEALAADQAVLAAMSNLEDVVLAYAPEIASSMSGVTKGGDSTARGPLAENKPIEQEGVPTYINVYGEDIDIGDLPPNFRATAPAIVENVLNHPLGMAFVDPLNQWGGYMGKTGSNKQDYLRSIKYLYKNGVFTRPQLRKLIRHNISKQGRRRHGAWREAVKYYRRNPVAIQKDSVKRQREPKKGANLLLSRELVAGSTNRSIIGMRKVADQYPNKYISDAISDLSDKYSRSYYAGLKSMYNTNPEQRDSRKVYNVHDERGADLIHESHPDAIVVSDAMGNGGLVENLLEQKSHSEGVAKSTPTGNFRGKHADLAVINALIKIANQADKDGKTKVSDLIDSTIQSILK